LKTANIETILGLLPHRYPFLLVDRVLEFDPDAPTRLKAMKNVTMNEPFFQGHFPNHPVMPGVLIIEAMAQAAGCLAYMGAKEDQQDQLFYLVKVDKARFSQIVSPGDQLIFEVEQKRIVRNMGLYQTVAFVDGKEVASAELLCAAKARGADE
jgi:3-hydroxyacyl-[acyl-carrier-protein] dehydratase